MEGKETRFDPEGFALMTVGTMGTTAGATDSALDSYTPGRGTGAFVAILLGVIIIVGGLIYFPMLILGPIGERIIG
jgi:potassium-transporting ATPase potassium-binding subunit